MTANIGMQLQSLKQSCIMDMEAVIKHLSQLGFSGVEFNGFHGHKAKDVYKMLEDNNMKLIASHIDAFDMLDDYDMHLKYHKELGCKKIVITMGEFYGAESLSMLISSLNNLQVRLERHGIELHYHNHEHEFKKYASGEDALTKILSQTNVKLELDNFWAQHGGANVLELLEKYKDRISLLHIKDGVGGNPSILGEGECDIKSIYDHAVNSDIEWIILELSSHMAEAMTAVERSVEYLNKI